MIQVLFSSDALFAILAHNGLERARLFMHPEFVLISFKSTMSAFLFRVHLVHVLLQHPFVNSLSAFRAFYGISQTPCFMETKFRFRNGLLTK